MIHPLCRGHRRIYKLKERLHCIPHKMDKFCHCRDYNLSRYKVNSTFSTKVLKHDIIGTIEKWPPFCFVHHRTVVSSKGWILLFLCTNHCSVDKCRQTSIHGQHCRPFEQLGPDQEGAYCQQNRIQYFFLRPGWNKSLYVVLRTMS